MMMLDGNRWREEEGVVVGMYERKDEEGRKSERGPPTYLYSRLQVINVDFIDPLFRNHSTLY